MGFLIKQLVEKERKKEWESERDAERVMGDNAPSEQRDGRERERESRPDAQEVSFRGRIRGTSSGSLKQGPYSEGLYPQGSP